MKKTWAGTSLRTKLILLFIVIKVVPLLLLGWVAWQQSLELADNLVSQIKQLTEVTDQAGNTAISTSVKALDAFVREEIERQSTDIALDIANFLYERDTDILYVATQKPDHLIYKRFIESKRKNLIYHEEWKLAQDGKSWKPVKPIQKNTTVIQDVEDQHFHYRDPIVLKSKSIPLYHEITFIGLDGKERIKITTTDLVSSELKDISIRQNTFAKAENYFSELKKLNPKEIYVSEVIGSYVGSKIIGPYTPEAASQKGIPYAPQNSAYAGKENPVGKRFKGIIRWATPVSHEDKIIGWVTLALNHDHLMQYTSTIVPTSERYSDIDDASNGNYAFIGDNKGRIIAHPRHHSIVGYDPLTGEPAVPWLEQSIYENWKKSGQPYSEFIKTVPSFTDPSSNLQPAEELTQSGNVAVDCRWINFSSQCFGLRRLTVNGGSGSFKTIWDGIWKITASSAIPYYTGQYAPEVTGNRHGFGNVSIGVNLDHFHIKSDAAKKQFDQVITQTKQVMSDEVAWIEKTIHDDTESSLLKLSILTLVMIGIVILIAIWMSIYLIRRINWLNSGCHEFQSGNYKFRFDIKEKNEITNLAYSFNEMADTLDEKIIHLKNEINARTQKENELQQIKDSLEIIVEERTKELSQINDQLRNEIEIRKIAEEKAQYLAGHDPLTSVANRYLFHERLEQAIYQANRSGKAGGLLFFDLDRFKQINDTLGHATGDALLIHVAQTLKESVRKTDTVARLGGDEFAVIITDLTAPDDAAILAEKILERFKDPAMLNGYELNVHTSIGITTFDGKNTDIEQILSESDMAMYQAKTEGGTHYRFFEDYMQNKVQAKKQLEEELRVGLEQKQFLPYFQPIFDFLEKRIVSMEVLLRWDHPELGITTPAEFIDIAISSNLLAAIDKQVIELACRQAKEWDDNGIEFGRISVNILPERISSPDFVDEIKGILDRTELSANKLALEITERALLADRDQVRDNLHQLQAMGAIIYIDDFGVEYSSLQRLIEYHIDVLKIDRFFVRRIGDPKAEVVIQAITSIARSIGMKIIVEGVETEKQLAYLMQHDCHIIQGYLHARPMSAENTTEHLLKYSR